MHWSKIPIHIIDFEGTANSGIVEYGIVTLYQDNIVETQTRLCGAIGELSQQDIRQHNITKDMIHDKLPFSEEWDLFIKMREKGSLGAHHAHTENRLLKSTWPFPRTVPDLINLHGSCSTWGPWIDTCQLFKIIYPQIKNYKLSNLIDVFQLNERLEYLSLKYCPEFRRKYHCALYDALASSVLLLYLLSLPELKECTVQWLIRHSTSLRKRTDMEQTLL